MFTPSPYFKGTFAIFPQGYFIMTHPPPRPPPEVYENFEKYPYPCLFQPLLQLSTTE